MVDFYVHIQGAMSVGCKKNTEKSETPSLVTLLAWVFAQVGPRTRTTILDAFETMTCEQLTQQIDEKLLEKAGVGIEAITASKDIKTRGDVVGSLSAELVPGLK